VNETWWIGEDQLDDDQKAIVAIEPQGNHLIIGPPGSGKTNLLLLHAKRMILSGQPNVLSLVFTRTHSWGNRIPTAAKASEDLNALGVRVFI
jgi:superfamily I DNA/RNA helicase